MSWRNRDDRQSRWRDDSRDMRWESRGRSPAWEPRRSASPDREHASRSPAARDRYHRDRYERDRRDRDREDRDRRDRYDRDREPDRRERDDDRRDRFERSRDRDRRRSPRREEKEPPAAPSPPKISADQSRESVASDRSSNDPDMDYGIDKEEDNFNKPTTPTTGDWICTCGSYNFRRREVCYRRNCRGKRSDGVVYGGDAEKTGIMERNTGITKKLLFRRLDALTTEEKILDTLKERCSKSLIDTITGISIGRETLTGASKCMAHIKFNSLADSSSARTELLNLDPPLEIDGREVLISYYNEPVRPPKPTADYASYYNHMSYSSTTQGMSEADKVNAAAAVAQSAIANAQARQMSWVPMSVPVLVQPVSHITPPVNAPTGDGKTVYKAPDVRTFLYDETSGYYYDPSTGLYYDGNTQYFYNNKTNKYMYWDGTSNTYVVVTQQTEQAQSTSAAAAVVEAPASISKEPEEKKKKDSKEDKVKVAKKIAKDMERWAKTLNQKKENAKSNYVMEQPTEAGFSKGSADIGFQVLGAGPSLVKQPLVRELSPPPPSTDEFLMKKTEMAAPVENDEGIIDWTKLTCLLCKRKFPSADVLTKHKTMSDLHKQNLIEFNKKNDEFQPQNNGYRDRAAERRMKFGEDEPAPIRKRYEPPPVFNAPISAPPPSVVDTIGGKMLQKMGWSEGRGLGKEGQGRIAPIEAEQRPSLAGLGQKRGIYTPTPGETYRDTVKKLMIARYKEVVGQEEGN